MKDAESSWIPSRDRGACFTNTQADGSVCVKRKVSMFSTAGFLWQQQLAERDQKVLSLTPHEHNVDVAPVVFLTRQENHP